MTIREIAYRQCMNEERRFREELNFINEVNIALEFNLYYNGNEEKKLAADIMRDVLSRYSPSMDLLPHQHKCVRELIEKYC